MASGIILLLIFHCNRLLIRKNIFVVATSKWQVYFSIMKFVNVFLSTVSRILFYNVDRDLRAIDRSLDDHLMHFQM